MLVGAFILCAVMIPNVLSIAGADPSGGAGIQADLKTFAALRCYGLSAITALTVQNTRGVTDVFVVPADIVAAQIDALFADSDIKAVKIGMLGSAEIAEVVASALARYRPAAIVLDPVMAATSGASLAVDDVGTSMITHLAPLVTLITPNLAEAAQLAKAPVPETLADMRMLASRLNACGFSAVLIKGGHRAGESCDDVLFDGSSFHVFTAPRVATPHTHGTGCTLSAAIAAHLALGRNLVAAIDAAKSYVQKALAAADRLSVGKGPGPLNHFHLLW